jgi:copper chaperone CopZ
MECIMKSITSIATMAALLALSGPVLAHDLNRMLSVKGMSCPICSTKVEHALTTVPGVKSAAVDLKSGQAKVVADERVKPAQLVDAVQKAGFDAETVKPKVTKLVDDPCCH